MAFNYLDELLKQSGGWGPDPSMATQFDPMSTDSRLGNAAQVDKERNALDAMFQGAIAGGDIEKAARLAVTPQQQALLSVALGQRVQNQDYRARMDNGIPTQAPPDLLKNYNDQQYTNLLRSRAEEDRQAKMQQMKYLGEKTQADTAHIKAQTQLNNAQSALYGTPDGSTGAMGMSTQSLEEAANRYRQDGTLPPNMGRGVQGAAQATAIRNRAAELDSAEGKDAVGARGRQLEFKNQYNTQLAADKNFAQGKLGSTVRSLSVATDHLNTLDSLADALNNSDVRLFNAIGNKFATETGQPAPTDFNAAKKIVADEIVKAIVGSGGGVSDREQAAKVIDAANSPQQLKGVIQTYKSLMGGQLGGLKQQYEASTGRKDFERFLTQGAKTQLMGATQKAPAVDANHPTDIQALLSKYGR